MPRKDCERLSAILRVAFTFSPGQGVTVGDLAALVRVPEAISAERSQWLVMRTRGRDSGDLVAYASFAEMPIQNVYGPNRREFLVMARRKGNHMTSCLATDRMNKDMGNIRANGWWFEGRFVHIGKPQTPGRLS